MTVQERKTLEEILRKNLEDDVTVKQMRVISEALHKSFADMDTMAIEAQSPENNDLLQAFIQGKRVAGAAESTINKYARTLKIIFREEKVSPANVTVDHLRHWISKELERGISESTLRGDRDAMCSFFGWLWREGLIPRNPCGNLEPIKCPKIVKKPFDAVEIDRMKGACWHNLRDRAIICFLLSSGCRISEAMQLNRNDIDFANKEVVVWGKGSKERTVYIDDIAAATLKDYLASRKDDSIALFHSRSSDRLTDDGAREMLKRIEKRTGVPNIHPHRFRRTLATELSKKGMPVEEIAMILGHEDVRTTMKYICKDKATVKHHYQTIVA